MPQQHRFTRSVAGAFLIVLFSLEGKVNILACFSLFVLFCFVLLVKMYRVYSVVAATVLLNFQHVTLKEMNSTFSFTRYLTLKSQFSFFL